MDRWKLFLLFCLSLTLLLPSAALAQEADELVVSGENSTLSIPIPQDWVAVRAPEGAAPYASLSNRGEGQNTPTDVQIIFRDLGALNLNLLAPIDTSTENPAYDYLFKYAEVRSALDQGRYNLPLEIPAAVPAALMLYVEQADGYRFGAGVPVVVALAVALYVGEDEMAVILLDGPATLAPTLLTMWGELLPTLQLDDEPLAVQLDALLPLLDAPAVLLDSYLRVEAPPTPRSAANTSQIPLPGENLQISLGQNTLLFSRYPAWEAELFGEFLAQMSHESGRAEMRLSFEPAEGSPDPIEALVMLAERAELVINGEPSAFQWGAVPAAVASVRQGRQAGTLVVAQSGESFLQALFLHQRRIDAQISQDWRNVMSAIRLNGQDMDYNAILPILATH